MQSTLLTQLILVVSCCHVWYVSANYAVFDVFASDLDCAARQPVQASVYREMNACINLPHDFPSSFFHATKKSYRFDSCANTFPQLSVSFTVYDKLDCTGEGEVVDLSDYHPAVCMSNVLLSCEENPKSKVENWPSIEMWAPMAQNSDATCNPNDSPHEVLYINPDGALFRDFPGENHHGIKAVCRLGDKKNDADDTMQLSLYRNIDSSPDAVNLPFWTVEEPVDKCLVIGDLFETCPGAQSCLELFPPGKGPMLHLAHLAGLSTAEQVYISGMTARTSVKFKCNA